MSEGISWRGRFGWRVGCFVAQLLVSSLAAAEPTAAADPQQRAETPLQSGQLVISTQPSGAAVSVDGKSYGTTPTAVAGLLPGAHIVVVKHVSGRDAQQVVQVVAGQSSVVDMTDAAPVGAPAAAAPAAPTPAAPAPVEPALPPIDVSAPAQPAPVKDWNGGRVYHPVLYAITGVTALATIVGLSLVTSDGKCGTGPCSKHAGLYAFTALSGAGALAFGILSLATPTSGAAAESGARFGQLDSPRPKRDAVLGLRMQGVF